MRGDPHEIAPHHPQNRGDAASKLRRGRKHCPVCLAPLAKNAGRTRLRRSCQACRAQPATDGSCARCGAHEIWQVGQEAACQACGLHGRRADVTGT